MARPAKIHTERRTMTLKARCSPDEKRRIEETAAAVGLSVSDYLRTAALHGRPQLAPPSSLPFELVYEINKTGVNMNQIAHKLNATGQLVPGDLAVTLERLNAVLMKAIGDGSENHER